MKSTPTARAVVITTRNDAHVPFVERHMDHPFIVIDPLEVAKGKRLTFKPKDGSIEVVYDGESLNDVCGVWYRKPQPVMRRELPVVDDYKLYSQSAIERLVTQLVTAFDKATWVSDFFTINRANNKTLQLAVASTVGLNVPDTIFTSDEAEAKEFIAQHERCITKPLVFAHANVQGEERVLLTTLLDKKLPSDLMNLYLAPSIFQEALDVAHDVRVIVVGDRVFAASVKSNVDEKVVAGKVLQIRDNRVGHYEGTVHIEEMHDFPDEIAEKCIKHTKTLGLNYGALDLILDKKGVWWFLENNPNGQWAYIENATGQPIGKALADMLSQR